MARQIVDISRKDIADIILKSIYDLNYRTLDGLSTFLRKNHGVDISDEELASVVNDLIFIKKISFMAYVDHENKRLAVQIFFP